MVGSEYKNNIINFSTISLILILICNLNAVSSSLLGINQVFSPLILVFSIIIIVLNSNSKSWDWSITSIFIFYLLHYVTGLVVRLFLIDEFEYKIPLKEVFFQCVTSLIIITAFYRATIYYIQLDRFYKLLNYLLTAFFISLAIVIFCFFTGWNPVKGVAIEDRGGGFFANPNEAGTAANLGLSLLMLKMIAGKNSSLLNIILFPIFVIASFITFSKMAIIITMLLIIIFFTYSFIYLPKLKIKNSFSVLFLFSLIFLIAAFAYTNFDLLLTYLSPEQGKRIKGILTLVIEKEINKNTTSERDIIAYIALQLIELRPFLGYGFGFFQQGLNSSDHGVHNTHLQVIGETGIPIYFFYLLIYAVLGIKILVSKNKDVSFIILLGLVAIFANNFASHNDLYNRIINAYWGIMCGIATFYQAKFRI